MNHYACTILSIFAIFGWWLYLFIVWVRSHWIKNVFSPKPARKLRKATGRDEIKLTPAQVARLLKHRKPTF